MIKTNILQEEAIFILGNIKIVKTQPIIKINDYGNLKEITRKYKIEKFYDFDAIEIAYEIRNFSEEITNYTVSLKNKKESQIILKSNNKTFNTLFNNLILFELSNWQRIVNDKIPLRTLNNFNSLIFELSESVRINKKLFKLCNDRKIYRQITEIFKDYLNTSIIIPSEKWQEICLEEY